jgi:hypothetical protein
MGMTKRLWSISGLATELGRDRRTIAKALSDLRHDGHIGVEKGWFLSTAISALDRSHEKDRFRRSTTLIDAMLGRVEDWRAVHGQLPFESFTVEQVSQLFGHEVTDVVCWLRAGMPYEKAGNWETGEGFRLKLIWTMEWVVLVEAYGRYMRQKDLLDRLALCA